MARWTGSHADTNTGAALVMANVWTEFQKLIPKNRLIVATVNQVNVNGTSHVTTVDGQSIIVRGNQVEINKKVFVKGGVIEGEAPNLPFQVIDV